MRRTVEVLEDTSATLSVVAQMLKQNNWYRPGDLRRDEEKNVMDGALFICNYSAPMFKNLERVEVAISGDIPPVRLSL